MDADGEGPLANLGGPTSSSGPRLADIMMIYDDWVYDILQFCSRIIYPVRKRGK